MTQQPQRVPVQAPVHRQLNNGSSSSNCTVTNSETEGPFPTKSPASYVRKDITDGQTGVAFTMNITIKNANSSCAALAGALVDVWHCDKAGNYSEYGGHRHAEH